MEPPGGTRLSTKRRFVVYTILDSLMKGLAVVIELSGEASHVGSILVFFGFLDDFDQRKS